jgi:hypothetical protein
MELQPSLWTLRLLDLPLLSGESAHFFTDPFLLQHRHGKRVKAYKYR